jgi:thioesterase domain-containing protein
VNGKKSRSDTILFLSSLRSQGVHVRAEGERLVCNAPKGALTAELRQQLVLRKPEILQLLAPRSYSVVEIQPQGSRPPLFGVHSTRYRTLSTHLGAEQPLYALRYGLARASVPPPLPGTLEELAEHYIEEMRRVQPKGPYHLIGLCIGGLLAFEMAHLLIDRGEEVGLLGLFDALAPGGRVPLPLHHRARNLLRAQDRLFFRRARVKLRSKVQKIVDEERDNVAQDVYRDHVPSRIYAGDVELFRPADRMSLTHRFTHDLGWGPLVQGRLEIHELPGEDHTAMFEEPMVRTVAEVLTACLETARAGSAAVAPTPPGVSRIREASIA